MRRRRTKLKRILRSNIHKKAKRIQRKRLKAIKGIIKDDHKNKKKK